MSVALDFEVLDVPFSGLKTFPVHHCLKFLYGGLGISTMYIAIFEKKILIFRSVSAVNFFIF
jgi:hypothetical protein